MLSVGVIPCYRNPEKAIDVVKECFKYLDLIICVDDCCPLNTGKEIKKYIDNENLYILYHKSNMGVGGAMKTGINFALDLGAEIIVKIDSDGQMPAELIPDLIRPLQLGRAEFTKGNRFRSASVIFKMPTIRLVGNFFLSFLTKMSTGYWELFDPTNGFIAFKSSTIKLFNLNKVDNRFFFETDILFRCSLNDILICEIPMHANYNDEESSLYPLSEIPNFLFRHILIFLKRIIYHYFLYSFNPGSFSLILSLLFGFFSFLLGGFYFSKGLLTQIETPTGIQALFLALVFISTQLFLNFIYYDVSQKPLFRKLRTIL